MARFRVNAFTQNRGAGAVFRTIPSEVLTLEDLGCPRIFKELIEQPQGLILLYPYSRTGSGKSTTLAAMVDHINKNEYGHMLTIEDPIEFVHTSQKCLVNQREVHRDTHGFNEALRSALREDPDYILVGELRDLETIRLALTAAETGHLVSPRCIPARRPRRSTASSTCSPPARSRWCARCCPKACAR
ncbi:Twitching motility protein PilT OS=Rhodanobacter lindaniclasticus OX=75310 GN=B1991_01375 PE=3 SV=1 [Rhodanobacter lindaniclasticus]